VGQLATASPFAEAGDAPPHLVLSALFRNDPAYRRFYHIWQDMNLGIAAVFGDFLSLPLARTFELYELWCFLRLVRAGVEEFGAGGIDSTHPATALVRSSLGGYLIGLRRRERRSEDASSKAGVRECAWQDDPAGGPAHRQAMPVDRCH
jgi:hypothetical protein